MILGEDRDERLSLNAREKQQQPEKVGCGGVQKQYPILDLF